MPELHLPPGALRLLRLAWAPLLAVGISLLTACDYPEQGFYVLRGSDADGAVCAEYALYVEEITDDSGITTGFQVLLPRDGRLVELPLTDSTDISRRAWHLALAASDSGAGDLDLTLSHMQERLSFFGAYLAPLDGSAVQDLLAHIPPGDGPELSRIVFDSALPQVATADGSAVPALEWGLAALSQDAFERLLGTTLAKATRVAAAAREPLDASAGAAGWAEPATAEPASVGDSAAEKQPDPAKPREKPRTPPLGGRKGTRPR